MSSAKVLITGLPNRGKTTLLKTLKNTLVFSRDGKPFPLEIPHCNVPDFDRIDDFINLISEKLDVYADKFKKSPDTIVFDSVSRIFTDIETNCSRRFNGFDVWSNVNKEINLFLDTINSLQNSGYNIVLVAHAVWDEKAGKYIETCKGSFAKTGGFLSTVDYALNIDMIGNKRIVTHRGNSLSRSLIEDMPDKQDVNEFNLQDYINKIAFKANTVTEKWSI